MEAEKILVVDDNKEIVYSISELLKYEGYETLKHMTVWKHWILWSGRM